MQESFLHFIWQHQYFDKRDLVTTEGQRIQILDPGVLNHHAGPDFLQARLKLDHTEWTGAVEIHVNSSQWYRHHHHSDRAYDLVVLHVVWKQDQSVFRTKDLQIPTLELRHRIDRDLLIRHQGLLKTPAVIPCHHQVGARQQPLLEDMFSPVLKRRLESKCRQVMKILALEGYHWDATCYRLLGRNFGFKINSEAFDELTKSVSLSIVNKIRHDQKQLEAIFFGQSGFLQDAPTDPYAKALQREYQYLLRLFPRLTSPLKKSQWKFLRLRPANFPTVRIAQFCALIHEQGYRFWKFRELVKKEEAWQILEIKTSAYWQHHYNFGKAVRHQIPPLGKSSKINILINTVLPLRMAYGYHIGDDYLEPTIGFLKTLPPESNQIVRYWKDLGFKLNSAYHSQALLALHQHFCKAKRCLRCKIGQSLIAGSGMV